MATRTAPGELRFLDPAVIARLGTLEPVSYTHLTLPTTERV